MNRFSGGFVMATLMATSAFSGPNDSGWIPLFRPNDTSLSDWIVKIQGQDLGVDPYRSFRYATSSDPSHAPRLEVIDTVPYGGSFGYGHLFYRKPFSDYLLRVQFHFPAKKSFAAGNGSWTIQNNGLMLHCQAPNTMGKGQAYPNSIEDQLLGYWSGTGGGTPHTRSSNLCLPGSTVDYGGEWYSDGTGHHCTDAKFHSLLYDSSTTPVVGGNSSNTTWPGADVWQYALARVLDSTSMTFWVRSRPDTAWDSVMGFTRVHLGVASSTTDLNGATPATEGYIAIQMEGTSTEFAKIELLDLVGCMDKKDTAYRAYFVKNDPTACAGTTGISASQKRAQGIFTLSGDRVSATSGILAVEAYALDGSHVTSFRGEGRPYVDVGALKPGLYDLRVRTRLGSAQAIYTKL